MNALNQQQPALGELFGELARETGALVKAEVQLAKTEMAEKARDAGKSAGMVGAGGALAHAGLLALIAALVLGLAQVMPMWIAAALVGVTVMLVGYVLIQRGLKALKRIDPAPRETLRTLKEDKVWAKQEMQQ